jgi:hypothetical protein
MQMLMLPRCTMRLTQRLELKPTFRIEAPPEAQRGFGGMKVANDILVRLGIPGLLIGSLARKAWTGEYRGVISSRKDVDVIVLSSSSEKHPSRFEGGIDWWVTCDPVAGPTNGNDCELIYAVETRNALAPGLYLATPDFLWAWRRQELLFFSNRRIVRDAQQPRIRTNPLIVEYPVPPPQALEWRFTARDRWR